MRPHFLTRSYFRPEFLVQLPRPGLTQLQLRRGYLLFEVIQVTSHPPFESHIVLGQLGGKTGDIEPSECLNQIRVYAVTLHVCDADIGYSSHIALFGGCTIPDDARDRILADTNSVVIAVADLQFRAHKATIRSFLIPGESLCLVLRHPAPLGGRPAEVVHCIRVSIFCGFLVPGIRLDRIFGTFMNALLGSDIEAF